MAGTYASVEHAEHVAHSGHQAKGHHGLGKMAGLAMALIGVLNRSEKK